MTRLLERRFGRHELAATEKAERSNNRSGDEDSVVVRHGDRQRRKRVKTMDWQRR
jgi:hypothetical protein